MKGTRVTGRRRKMLLGGEEGGILASLHGNNNDKNTRKRHSNSQGRSVPKKTPPPKTLVISKPCSDDEQEYSASCDVDNEVSALESPSLQPRRLLDNDKDEDSSSTTREEDDDEDATSEEDNSVGSDGEETSGESESEQDDDDDESSDSDEDVVTDEESLVAQGDEDDTEIEDEDPTAESDYDPDDEGFESDDDDELEADDDSDVVPRVPLVHEKDEKNDREKEATPTVSYFESNKDSSNETEVSVAMIDESSQDEDEDEAVAEIVEDSTCESFIDTSSSNKGIDATRENFQKRLTCTDMKENVEIKSQARVENDDDLPSKESSSVSEVSLGNVHTVQSSDCQALSLQLDSGTSNKENHEESILKMVLNQGNGSENDLFSSLSGRSGFGVESSPGVTLSNRHIAIQSEKENGSSSQEEGTQSLPVETLGDMRDEDDQHLLKPKVKSVARASSPIIETIQGKNQLELTVPVNKMGGLSITEKCTANATDIAAPIDSNTRLLRREGSIKRGHWKLGSKIGSGAFGVVHVGLNTRSGTLMAVKSIRMEKAVMKDVRVEIDLLKSLHHTNIVRYIGAQMDEKYLHIFQEWIPGGSLTSLLSKFGAFPMPVVRNYLSQILEGLSHLHEKSIMHRDLKGSNILVSDSGVVKIADFGASKKFERLKHDMMLSLTVRGTPYFMAPEVFEEKYSTKADIWSVGCIAIQMATGNAPWKALGKTNPIALFNHVKGTEGLPEADFPVPESDSDRNEMERFKKLLKKCFPRDPKLRPTARLLLSDVFFVDEQCFSEGDETFDESPFSPAPHHCIQSPLGARLSPIPGTATRRNSVGSLTSPFMSPPMPKPTNAVRSPLLRSPIPDPSGWPTWARDKHKVLHEGKSDAATKTLLEDSLYLSDDSIPSKVVSEVSATASQRKHSTMTTTTRSPLHGLQFLSK